MHWADKAALEIEKELDEGYISDDEYRKQMRDLREELEAARQEAAENAANDYYY